jgi:hypothetical protein
MLSLYINIIEKKYLSKGSAKKFGWYRVILIPDEPEHL